MKKTKLETIQYIQPADLLKRQYKRTLYARSSLDELEFLKIELEIKEDLDKQSGYYLALLTPTSILLAYLLNKGFNLYLAIFTFSFFIITVVALSWMTTRSFRKVSRERKIIDLVIQDKKELLKKIESHREEYVIEAVNQSQP